MPQQKQKPHNTMWGKRRDFSFSLSIRYHLTEHKVSQAPGPYIVEASCGHAKTKLCNSRHFNCKSNMAKSYIAESKLAGKVI